MIAATVCSGIGAPEVAMPEWEYSFQSEIENFPREVLKVRQHAQDARYKRGPGPALWGDFTAIRVRFLRRLGIPLPQWLVAGTPCQAFSVAGLRQSLADDRGNLTLEFVRLVHALRRAGSLRGFTWENVPGVLSTKDNAFGCFLAAVVGADAPLRSPLEQGRWPDAGMVAGPWARVAWRILDAQYCGLAQRRRRVILVADFGGWIDPAAVLFERHSLSGDTPPRREKGERIADSLTVGANQCSGFPGDFTDDISPALCTQSQSSHGADSEAFVPVASTGDISHCLNAGGMGRQDYETETLIASIQERAVSDNPNAGPDGAGFRTDGQAYTLEARTVPQAVALMENQQGEVWTADTFQALNKGGGKPGQGYPCVVTDGSHANSGVMPAVAFGGDTVRSLTARHDSSPCADRGMDVIARGSAVRRLTPRECERLQGFPDDYTLIPYRGKPAADGPRYKALGNSMAVPVMRWIGERIQMVETIGAQARAA